MFTLFLMIYCASSKGADRRRRRRIKCSPPVLLVKGIGLALVSEIVVFRYIVRRVKVPIGGRGESQPRPPPGIRRGRY